MRSFSEPHIFFVQVPKEKDKDIAKMREIFSPDLSNFSSVLSSNLDCGSYVLSGKCECYCAKLQNKSLKKRMEERLDQSDKRGMLPHSPQNWSIDSPFGSLVNEKSRQTYCELIEVLNTSYPDFSFDNIRPMEFRREHLTFVMNSLNQKLTDSFGVNDKMSMWNIFAELLGPLDQCEIYSYNANSSLDDDDPFGVGGGKLWHDTYFFVSNQEKKILFFTIFAMEKRCCELYQSDSDDSDFDMSNPKNVDFYIQPRQNMQWGYKRDVMNTTDIMEDDDFSTEW